MNYQVYNTADQVWTSRRYGQRVVVKVVTHDGLTWEEGGKLQKLTGVELRIHQVQSFLIRLILKVIS